MSDSDLDGLIEITLDASTEYRINALAADLGWPGAWTAEDGSEFHFSISITTTGRDAPNGGVLSILETVAVLVEIVDDLGQHFPPGVAGIMACRQDTCRTDFPEWRVGTDDDGDGLVDRALDAGVEYEVRPHAVETGWCNPQHHDPDGGTWHFGATEVVAGPELDGRRLEVANPCR